jgi:hypothetical protein
VFCGDERADVAIVKKHYLRKHQGFRLQVQAQVREQQVPAGNPNKN